MAIRIGANPIGWSNDDMRELGGETPLETCPAAAKEAGFEGMELGHKFPREPEAQKRTPAPFGLACVSGWHSAELLTRDAEAELAALRPHLDLLKAMGCGVLVFAETPNAIHGDIGVPLSRRPVLEPGRWAEFGRRMTEVADATLRDGVRLVYHHHMGTVVQSKADIDALMAATGSVIEGVYTVPGDGMVDYPAVFRALPGYSGWVVIEAEQDPKRANPLHYAKLGHANLKRFLAEAGLRRAA